MAFSKLDTNSKVKVKILFT